MKCGDSIIKGDVIIIINEIQHSVYHRVNNDLIVKEILLLE
jgi:DnaJ-class molecular chaperone